MFYNFIHHRPIILFINLVLMIVFVIVNWSKEGENIVVWLLMFFTTMS